MEMVVTNYFNILIEYQTHVLKKFIWMFLGCYWTFDLTTSWSVAYFGEDEENWHNDPKMGLVIDYKVRGMMDMARW